MFAYISPSPSTPFTLTTGHPQGIKHDVFLSFSEQDTLAGFTSHLHAALDRKQILTFIDYQLVRGDEISASLLRTIEEAKLSMIVFVKIIKLKHEKEARILNNTYIMSV